MIVVARRRRREARRRFAQHRDCGADLAFVDKRRPKGTANVVEAREVIGDVEGRPAS